MLMALAVHRSFPAGWRRGRVESDGDTRARPLLSAEALSQASWSAEGLPRAHQTKTLSVGSVAHS